jgi:hypothetical protein
MRAVRSTANRFPTCRRAGRGTRWLARRSLRSLAHRARLGNRAGWLCQRGRRRRGHRQITTLAGVLFALLRMRSGSIIASVIAHSATTSFAYLGALVVFHGGW